MELNRVTSGVRFDTGISNADWTSGVVGQTPGQTQEPLMPGSTTVTEALKSIFPTNVSVGEEIMAARELENLLADTELLDHYRAALLET